MILVPARFYLIIRVAMNSFFFLERERRIIHRKGGRIRENGEKECLRKNDVDALGVCLMS